MKLTKVFWITLAIMIVLFILPSILTFSQPFVDGQWVHGFPIVIYATGGWCVVNDSCPEFSLLNLIVDLIVIILIPSVANLIYLRKTNQ